MSVSIKITKDFSALLSAYYKEAVSQLIKKGIKAAKIRKLQCKQK